jgi:hypothetical protein
MLTTHLQLAQRSRKCGSIHLLPHTPSWLSAYICTMFGVLGPFTSRVYVTYHFWTPICNVLGYWRHRPICYTSLFTTSLVVTTISVYHVLGPSYVASLSGPGFSLDLLLGSSLICVSDFSFDLSFLCVSSVSLFYLCLLSVSLLSFFCVCPFICCPSNTVLAPGKDDTSPHGYISRCSGFQ